MFLPQRRIKIINFVLLITKINWKLSGKTFLEISFVPRWKFICWSEICPESGCLRPTGSVFIQKVWLLQTGGSQETSAPAKNRKWGLNHHQGNLERLRAISVTHYKAGLGPQFIISNISNIPSEAERSLLLSRFLARKERTFHLSEKETASCLRENFNSW